MPELPEVQTIVAGLSARLIGARIASIEIARPDVIHAGRDTLAAALCGARIDAIERQAKRIVIRADPPATLIIHLGMSGRLTLTDCGEPVEKHTHVRIKFAGHDMELRFRDPRRFGGLWFSSGDNDRLPDGLRIMGPDALSIRVPVLRDVLRKRRQLKALLLDQTAIGGMGNIYCDEALFEAGLHPLTRAADLGELDVRRLACAIRKTLRRSLESGGSTLRDYRRSDGSEGFFQKRVRVYGRTGQPCRRCGAVIVRITAAGRSTHICPRCQRKRPMKPLKATR